MSTLYDPREYSVVIRQFYSEDDGLLLFEASVLELPDIKEYSDSLQEVYELVIDTIAACKQTFDEYKRLFPSPVKQVSDLL